MFCMPEEQPEPFPTVLANLFPQSVPLSPDGVKLTHIIAPPEFRSNDRKANMGTGDILFRP
jgi:hypothetical protein